MFEALAVLLPASFVALDPTCGPGSISQWLLTCFPGARAIAVDIDPVILAVGQGAIGTIDGRLRWIQADLASPAGWRNWAKRRWHIGLGRAAAPGYEALPQQHTGRPSPPAARSAVSAAANRRTPTFHSTLRDPACDRGEARTKPI
jgi:hypothetical protein